MPTLCKKTPERTAELITAAHQRTLRFQVFPDSPTPDSWPGTPHLLDTPLLLAHRAPPDTAHLPLAPLTTVWHTPATLLAPSPNLLARAHPPGSRLTSPPGTPSPHLPAQDSPPGTPHSHLRHIACAPTAPHGNPLGRSWHNKAHYTTHLHWHPQPHLLAHPRRSPGTATSPPGTLLTFPGTPSNLPGTPSTPPATPSLLAPHLPGTSPHLHPPGNPHLLATLTLPGTTHLHRWHLPHLLAPQPHLLAPSPPAWQHLHLCALLTLATTHLHPSNLLHTLTSLAPLTSWHPIPLTHWHTRTSWQQPLTLRHITSPSPPGTTRGTLQLPAAHPTSLRTTFSTPPLAHPNTTTLYSLLAHPHLLATPYSPLTSWHTQQLLATSALTSLAPSPHLLCTPHTPATTPSPPGTPCTSWQHTAPPGTITCTTFHCPLPLAQ
ncbi:hypothetical protein C7M84_020847 [Penaeus vannamei]|uniref:Uncharacterized protein n=1 Tax=Penaeus vannamei TaxID=6689 RepID=A0A423SB02_PENVA|nr:hypothetical protein C7M84_020847 [Penaeus vannamei]